MCSSDLEEQGHTGGCTSYGAGTVPTPPAAGPRHVWLSQQHLGNKLFTRSYFSLL